ncbi:IclR family transcriptional regulator [Acinetobacter sp. RIT698]|jgi:DNA-binding IclR family transcriptional regulator|uniref:IclR family transcriptional regulator n=1 Tax=Acinetobacter TaxID=469 RepID=UPI00125FE96A|nr:MULTISPECIES: IclR family transcriptional regulator C-terminal domain-containing protein [Acinetobacter]MRT38653.1 IclR family transcriptional regulator [Acinetobacter sp. RIT698]
MNSSLARILNVLNLFGPEQLEIDAELIAQKFDLSRTSSYRYIKELCDAGLIVKRGPGGYALGPRVIELDWMMRKYDPVLSTGRPYLENLSQITGLTVFVSAFYDSKIINTFILSPNNDMHFSFGRGRPLPLFRGAQAKVLTSYRSIKKIKQLYEAQISKDPLNIYSLEDVLKISKNIRKNGYCATNNELNVGNIGIAAPIFSDFDSKEVTHSVCVVGSDQQFNLLRQETIIEILLETAKNLTQSIVSSPKPKHHPIEVDEIQIQREEVEHLEQR